MTTHLVEEDSKTLEDASAVLSLKNISISFGGVSVLENVSFSLKKNEIHAIVGKNGAGKSTLMKVLSGVYTADKGDIVLLGNSIKTGQSDIMLKQGLSMVYQDLSLIPTMTVTQNIFLAAHPFKKWGILQDKKARTQINSIFEMMGIDFISPESTVQDLSVGESQLVEIAKSLSNNSKIIVFDEPTASLSDVETAQLFKIIGALQSQGISIIYITHYLEDVMSLCNSVTVLRDGKIISTKAIEETSIAKIVGQMLGKETSSFKRNKRRFIQGKENPFLNIQEAKTEKVGPIDFYAGKGEIVGLAGLLGSGRTEILRMLYGLDTLKSGRISIAGAKMEAKHPADARKRGIVLVPEERRTQGLVLDFSIEHNLSLTILKKLKGFVLLSGKKQFEVAKEVIANLHIKARGTKQSVRFLSGGNQQKVVFGKCLASEPSVLLLDDPTFGVDVYAKIEIMKIIEGYANRGNTVIFVSSELSEIANFCDRTYIVKKKQIFGEVDNVSLTEESLLKMVQ